MSATNAMENVATKLAVARARLVLEKPFIGALLLYLRFEAAGWCASVATDARKLYFNPAYIDSLNLRQTQFVLAHQALHCALGHFARRQHRLRKRWDLACDHAVNHLLVEESLEPAPGVQLEPVFRGLSAEEIYPLIGDSAPQASFDVHLFDVDAGIGMARSAGLSRPSSSGEGEALAASDDSTWSDAASHSRQDPRALVEASEPVPSMDALAERWQMRLAFAAQRARHAGRLGVSGQRLLEKMLQPVLPWRELLARFVLSRAQEDYTFQRPARRECTAALPRLQSGQIDLYVALDTSGSVGEAELSMFMSEVDALKAQLRARVTLHACDSELAPQGPWRFEPWEPVVLPDQLTGGGGTDFVPVFEWIHDDAVRPDLLLYFTDAEGEFPELPPPYPVLWLVKGRAPVPWGERIQLN